MDQPDWSSNTPRKLIYTGILPKQTQMSQPIVKLNETRPELIEQREQPWKKWFPEHENQTVSGKERRADLVKVGIAEAGNKCSLCGQKPCICGPTFVVS
ncbi:hypothetical protein V2G26_012883 [Clonostachys chloroleuca]